MSLEYQNQPITHLMRNGVDLLAGAGGGGSSQGADVRIDTAYLRTGWGSALNTVTAYYARFFDESENAYRVVLRLSYVGNGLSYNDYAMQRFFADSSLKNYYYIPEGFRPLDMPSSKFVSDANVGYPNFKVFPLIIIGYPTWRRMYIGPESDYKLAFTLRSYSDSGLGPAQQFDPDSITVGTYICDYTG